MKEYKMGKKNLLFVIDSLKIGGGEKSLITLLKNLDYSKFDIDLQLFGFGGKFEKFLPKQVNLLPQIPFSEFLAQPLYKQILKPGKFFARIIYSIVIRLKKSNHTEKAVLYWKYLVKHFETNTKEYDVAIAYAQGVPTFYTLDKIRAQKKIAWINIDVHLKGKVKQFQKLYYAKTDYIVTVSNIVYNIFTKETFPEFKYKIKVIRDILDPRYIKEMAVNPDLIPAQNSIKIMTSGRLDYMQKGYDLALQTAQLLKERNINFTWYAIGEGPFRKDMEEFIIKNKLEENFILLGATDNPYQYVAQCDIYVQPSRHEGFGLTIAEAKILNKPVVCTAFDGHEMQIKDGENGLVASFEPSDIADKIEHLIKDKDLYDKIKHNLANEKIGNIEEIQKFYELIDS